MRQRVQVGIDAIFDAFFEEYRIQREDLASFLEHFRERSDLAVAQPQHDGLKNKGATDSEHTFHAFREAAVVQARNE